MRQHIASAHGNEKPFKCAICNHRCALKHNLTQHIKRVHEKKIKNQCKECDMTFAKRDDLKFHTREVHEIDVIPVKNVSNIDLNIKVSKDNVQSDHEKKEIDGEKINNVGPVIDNSKLAIPENNNLIQSDAARDLSFENDPYNQIWYDEEKREPQFENTSKASKTNHDNAENSKTEIGKILCSKILPNRNYHGNTSNEKSHDINLDKVFKSEEKFPEKKPLACDYCDETYYDRRYLKNHIGTVHEGKNHFQCPFCDFNYSRKDVLNKHIRSCHEKTDYETNLKKLLKCPSCDYKPLKREHLRRHIKNVHQFEKTKLLKCPFCDYKPLRREHLRRHIKNVHQSVYLNKNLFCQ